MTNGADSKECPYCGEIIKTIAKKCRYCGEFLDGNTREIGPEVNTGGGSVIGKDVTTGRDFVGRDQINLGKALRDEQFQIASNWDGRTKLREYDLSGRRLSGLSLEGVDLSGANLNGADMNGINLSKANLRGAVLKRSDLKGANLRSADFSGANLREADLRGANLGGANLSGADVSSSDLSSAQLVEPDFDFSTVLSIAAMNLLSPIRLLRGYLMLNRKSSEMNVSEVMEQAQKNLSPKVPTEWIVTGKSLLVCNISGAKFDKYTKWPESLNPIEAGAVLVEEHPLDE